MSELKLSKGAYADLEQLQKDLGDLPWAKDVISYTPQCSCGGLGCFHEEVQSWVCCQERKRNPGCGKIIKTMKEYKGRHY